MKRFISILILGLAFAPLLSAQTDRKEIRSGNRKFEKEDYRGSAVEYMRAIDKDSSSIAANYDLASAHYRMGEYDSAAERMGKIKENIAGNEHEADYHFNAGDIAIARKDWRGAVDAFKQCLLKDPGNIEAKENYIYARKHLEDQQQNQDQQDKDQKPQDDQDQNQKDQNQDQKDQDKGNQQPKEPRQAEVKVSPEQARQMLQAIQAREKKTQEKVEKEKAASAGSRQKDKNW